MVIVKGVVDFYLCRYYLFEEVCDLKRRMVWGVKMGVINFMVKFELLRYRVY